MKYSLFSSYFSIIRLLHFFVPYNDVCLSGSGFHQNVRITKNEGIFFNTNLFKIRIQFFLGSDSDNLNPGYLTLGGNSNSEGQYRPKRELTIPFTTAAWCHFNSPSSQRLREKEREKEKRERVRKRKREKE